MLFYYVVSCDQILGNEYIIPRPAVITRPDEEVDVKDTVCLVVTVANKS